MNGSAPNPGEGWASTGKVENRYIPIGTAEAVQAWLAPRGRRSQAIANEDKNLCSVPARYVQGFHTSIAFSMARKTMAQSVPMAASSEQGRNYKSELAYVRWVALHALQSWNQRGAVTGAVSQTCTLIDCFTFAVPPAINPATLPS